MPIKALTLKHIQSFCGALRERLMDRSSSLGKEYLRLLVDEIRVEGKQVVIKGGYHPIPGIIATKKVGTLEGMPAFGLDWLPGTDSNCRPSGYKCPDISTRLGLSHHPSQFLGLRVSGASPPEFTRRVRAEALVSAPSLNSHYSGLGSGLPFSTTRGGQASLNSPDFSTTISRGSCSLPLQPPALPTELPGKN